ncbi:hypothetical protein [Spiroplasma poulsonii]|uniref:hypothetical protein n=1 Tax=Spiroplasma poulsonii TaxID=2138 RepID=UPI001F4CDE87|nr:hypothetical protein [Spiroplasma poulsonii]UNF61995.1 hypothetical protein MNU24_00580 [Spiroplasma poulsonii]
MVKLIKLSLEIDYWWLYYIDRNIRLIFILVKVLILGKANCYRNIKWIEDILI